MNPVRPRTLAALVAFLSTWPVAAQTPVVTTTAPQNVVSLSASATAEIPVDELAVVFAVTRDGAEAAAVQAQVRQALEAALAEARKAARPGAVEVRTGNFSLMPRWSPKGTGQGWVGQAELVVEGRDMAAVSQLVGRITTMTVARTAYSLSRERREQADVELTAQAVSQFRQRAERAARLFGFGGWSLREVQIHGGDAALPSAALMRSSAVAAGGEALPVEAGKAQVTVTVSGSVQLSPR